MLTNWALVHPDERNVLSYLGMKRRINEEYDNFGAEMHMGFIAVTGDQLSTNRTPRRCSGGAE